MPLEALMTDELWLPELACAEERAITHLPKYHAFCILKRPEGLMELIFA